jgi:GH18 family chitinase
MRGVLVGLALLIFVVPSHAQGRVVAYVPNWIDVKSFSETIDYAKLTHINIAFENPVDAEGNLSFNAKNTILFGT